MIAQSSPAVFLASAAEQAKRMAAIAAAAGDADTADMLRLEAEKLSEQASQARDASA